jgi:hypothetical protein
MNALALLACLAVPGADDDLTPFLYPEKTQRVAIINMAAIRDSGLFTEEIVRGFDRAIKENEQLKKIVDILKFDPKSLNAVTICEVNDARPPQNAFMIVSGVFAYESASKQLAELGKTGELTAMSFEDQPVYFNHQNREASFFSLLDDKTLILSANKDLVKDALAGALPPDARRGLSRVPQLAPLADKLVGYNVVGKLGANPKLQLRLTLTEAQAATQAVAAFNGLLELGKLALANNPERNDVREILEKLTLTADKADLVAEINVTAEKLGEWIVQSRKDREKFEERMKARRAKMRERDKEREKDGKKDPPAEGKVAA